MPRTGRNLRLTPFQREVLWMLEEAGEENIPAILNTIQVKFSEEPYQNLLPQAEAAIHGLWDLRLVSFSRDFGKANLHNVQLDEAESHDALLLEVEVEYETHTRKWKWRSDTESYPISLILTGAGKAALTS